MLRAARSQWVGENDDHQVHFWHDGSTADAGTAMDENLAASDVVGNRTHDGSELVNWNRLSIINGNVNVGDFAARIARRSLTERNHG